MPHLKPTVSDLLKHLPDIAQVHVSDEVVIRQMYKDVGVDATHCDAGLVRRVLNGDVPVDTGQLANALSSLVVTYSMDRRKLTQEQCAAWAAAVLLHAYCWKYQAAYDSWRNILDTAAILSQRVSLAFSLYVLRSFFFLLETVAGEYVNPMLPHGEGKPGSDPHIQQLNDRKPKE